LGRLEKSLELCLLCGMDVFIDLFKYFSLILKLCLQVAPMEAVPARVQTGKTFGEVFFREATASYPIIRTLWDSAVLYLLFQISGHYIIVLQQLKIFSQNTRNKIVLPLFRFQNNAYDFSFRRQCFFGEYVSEMYLRDTYIFKHKTTGINTNVPP
jgi:hypothetical protein